MSAGRFNTIVEKDAYASVEMATHATSQKKESVNTIGISNVIPMPEITTTSLRAAPTGQPRLISQLENPPPAKLPMSAARKGTQKASRLSSGLWPLEARKIASQSVMKNQTGSVSVLPMM